MADTYRFDRATPPYLTVFERTKILAYRAEQLDRGQPPTVDPRGEVDTLKIAKLELEAGTLGHLCVRRSAPGGATESWAVTDLIDLYGDDDP